jgi:Secretion system C-terminal sorting domain
MNKSLLSLFALLITSHLTAQIDTLWARSIGGSADDTPGLTLACSIGSPQASVDTVAGFVYVLTSTNSADGDVTNYRGNSDLWLVKMTLAGSIVWQKTFGGSDFERARMVKGLPNGGCVIVGTGSSTDFNFVGNHGMMDAFVAIVDANGTIATSKLYGGTADDFLYDIKATSDGNYILSGESGSSNGDLAGTGLGTSWMLKINGANLNVIWSKTYIGPNAGANAIENFYRVLALNDGSGYIAAGFTTSDFGNSANDNMYIQKVDVNGNALWMKNFGSTDNSDYPMAMLEASGGDFYIAGLGSGTAGSDLGSTFFGGVADMWLIKFQSTGTKIWDRHFGGTDWEFAFDLKKDANNDLYLAGFTRSVNNTADTTGAGPNAYGSQDLWVVKTDPVGAVLYTKRVGGSGITLLGTDDFIVAGKTDSNNGYVHGNHGLKDTWVVRFKATSNINLQSNEEGIFSLYPNPTAGTVFISFENNTTKRIQIVNTFGQIVLETFANTSTEIDLNSFLSGLYSVIVIENDIVVNKRLVLQK